MPRQAGGHWFEPSTALSRLRVTGGNAEALALSWLGPVDPHRLGFFGGARRPPFPRGPRARGRLCRGGTGAGGAPAERRRAGARVVRVLRREDDGRGRVRPAADTPSAWNANATDRHSRVRCRRLELALAWQGFPSGTIDGR